MFECPYEGEHPIKGLNGPTSCCSTGGEPYDRCSTGGEPTGGEPDNRCSTGGEPHDRRSTGGEPYDSCVPEAGALADVGGGERKGWPFGATATSAAPQKT